jgi:hypothetical protein
MATRDKAIRAGALVSPPASTAEWITQARALAAEISRLEEHRSSLWSKLSDPTLDSLERLDLSDAIDRASESLRDAFADRQRLKLSLELLSGTA